MVSKSLLQNPMESNPTFPSRQPPGELLELGPRIVGVTHQNVLPDGRGVLVGVVQDSYTPWS